MKHVLLLILGSLLINASYAQCPAGETEITIRFIEDGGFPNEVNWDYKIKNTLSGLGPYSIFETITTCVPEGDLTIIGCDTFGDTWNGAVLEVRITEDGSLNSCTNQNGCKLYTSTVQDSQNIPQCNGNIEHEIVTIAIETCGETAVVSEGCTNIKAINYEPCAVTDDGSCIIPATNNCADAELISILNGDYIEYEYEYFNPNGSVNILNECQYDQSPDAILNDGFYKFIVPASGQLRFESPAYYFGVAIYEGCENEPLYCNNGFSFTNLNPNDTLILQIFNTGNEDQKIPFCLKKTEATTNSSCADAELVAVAKNGICNYVSLEKFNDNPLDIKPDCADNALSDAFYKFIVPPAGRFKISTLSGHDFALYTACDKANIFCETNVYDKVFSNLTPGDSLLLQVFGVEYEERLFCLEEAIPSSNNDCVNATFINILEDNDITYTNTYDDVDKTPSCLTSVYADAFFSFVVPPSGQVSLHSSYGSIQFALYKNCSEEAIFCDEASRYLFTNLTPGDSLLLQFSSQNEPIYFQFSLKDAPPTENNDCTNAKFIEIATADNYTINAETLLLSNNSLSIEPNCDSANYDAFYEFIVPPSGKINIISDERIGISIQSSCDKDVIFCGRTNWNSIEIENLQPGDKLLLQIYASSLSSNFSFYIEEVAISINNNCSNATQISIAPAGECSLYEVDLNLAYNTIEKTPSCTENVTADVFYKITVPPSGTIKIAASTYFGFALLNECNGQELLCSVDSVEEIISDLTPGETLILQIFYAYYGEKLSFCIEEVAPSINNNCTNATSITVAESGSCDIHQVSIKNLNYNTVNIEPSCTKISYDVFYEFVVPESGQVSFASTERVGVAVYQTCNSRSLFCDYYSNNKIIRDLPIGDTVILQIFEYYDRADITFCLEEVTPTLNNLCVNAEPFIVNQPGNCEGNYIQVANSSNNNDVNPNCASFVMADAFYSFIVPPSGHIAVLTSKEVGISIYNDCLEESYYCNNSFTDEVIYNLSPGDTLILQAFQLSNPTDFELCLSDAPPSINNNCADAISLQVYDEGTCEGNYIAVPINNNSVNINPSCEYIAADIFYKITVPENGQIRMYSNSSYRIGYAFYTTCDTTSILCKNDLDEKLIYGLPPNEEVLLQIFQNSTPYDFELCIEKAIESENNDCSNPIPLNIGAAHNIFEQIDTLNMKNNTVDIQPSCYAAERDAFYSFIVPANGEIAIYTPNRFGIALYKDCNSESIFCGQYFNDQLVISNLPQGEELILQIFDRYSYGQIEFSITETIDNVSCESAALLCKSSLIGSNVGGTQNITIAGSDCIPNYKYLRQASWYNFTTNNVDTAITLTISKTKCSYRYTDLYAVLLSNACDGEYVEEACVEINDIKNIITIDNPLPNQSYYLVIGDDSNSHFCNFEIEVVEGVELDCCQMSYTLNTWCNNQDVDNYYANVKIENFGENPSGFSVVGTDYQIKNLGTTTIGPISNGTNVFTLQGIDNPDCMTTQSVEFNCTACGENLIHENVTVSGKQNFSASKFIESNVEILPNAIIRYSSGDSIILKEGFTIEKGAEFTIDIEDCEE